tara:strand:+ start:325 stop:1107 length:783 start_codon:yes stop_codon:yes gene_type:complete
MKNQAKINPFILNISSGVFAFIRKHVTASGDEAEPRCVKDRKFQTGTDIRTAEIRKDTEALNRATVTNIMARFASHGFADIPTDVVSAALQELEQAVIARSEGTNKKPTPSITESIIVDSSGRDLVRAIQNRRSGLWSLQICNVSQSWSNYADMTEDEIAENKLWHREERAHKLNNCADRARKQADKWIAQEVKTQSLSNVRALINKVIDREPSTARHFTLISQTGEITCDQIAIGGRVFTSMIDIVVAYRPDLLPLFER